MKNNEQKQKGDGVSPAVNRLHLCCILRKKQEVIERRIRNDEIINLVVATDSEQNY